MLSMLGLAMGRWIGTVFGDQHDEVVMIFDSVLTGKKRDAFKATVKPELKRLGVPFRILFHPVKSDLNGQIADYFSWAWFRKVEHDDAMTSTALAAAITWDQFDFFARGNWRYY